MQCCNACLRPYTDIAISPLLQSLYVCHWRQSHIQLLPSRKWTNDCKHPSKLTISDDFPMYPALKLRRTHVLYSYDHAKWSSIWLVIPYNSLRHCKQSVYSPCIFLVAGLYCTEVTQTLDFTSMWPLFHFITKRSLLFLQRALQSSCGDSLPHHLCTICHRLPWQLNSTAVTC